MSVKTMVGPRGIDRAYSARASTLGRGLQCIWKVRL